jgi:hypothetical protein
VADIDAGRRLDRFDGVPAVAPLIVLARACSNLALLTTWLGSALYVWAGLDRGWWPHDEGALADPALRILNGQMPHRDFVDAYTGGLSYLHAAAFLMFGRELSSLRLVLFAAFVAWVPAVYYIGSRFMRRFEAVAVTLVAIAWSVPNYTASVPSWYCTFLATFGVAALLAHMETPKRRWLFTAGLCGGLSIAVKVVGVYYVGAVVVYLLFKATTDPVIGERPRRSRAFTLTATTISAALGLAVLLLLRSRLGLGEAVNFAVPVLALGGFSYWVVRATDRDGAQRLRSFVHLLAPLLAGVLVPLAVLVTPYLLAGATGDLFRGMWPTRRLNFAAEAPPTVWTLLALLPIAILIWGARYRDRMGAGEKRFALGTVAILGAAGIVASAHDLAYVLIWQSVRAIVPVVTLGGLVLVARRRSSLADPAPAQRVVLLVAVAAMCSLVQFPFAAPIYFAYVAPLVILAAFAVAVYGDLLPRPMLSTLVVVYLVFGVVRLNTGTLAGFGYGYRSSEATHPVRLLGTGLDVSPRDRAEYTRAVGLVERHSGGAKYIYAGPDAPELYYLTGLANPTMTLLEFLDPHPPTVSGLLQTLGATDVRVVAINRRPAFSGPISPQLAAALALRYPHRAYAGRFLIRWRT